MQSVFTHSTQYPVLGPVKWRGTNLLLFFLLQELKLLEEQKDYVQGQLGLAELKVCTVPRGLGK